tara:strand:- start:870 stop:1217 length:348 start_codon:yes stop_codon:yes gene_type:complete
MNDIKIIIAKQKEINDLSQLYLNALMEIDKLRDNNNLLKLKLDCMVDDKNEAEDELIDNDNKINYNCEGCKQPSKGMPQEGRIDCTDDDMGCIENLYGRWTCEDCYGKKIIKKGW